MSCSYFWHPILGFSRNLSRMNWFSAKQSAADTMSTENTSRRSRPSLSRKTAPVKPTCMLMGGTGCLIVSGLS